MNFLPFLGNGLSACASPFTGRFTASQSHPQGEACFPEGAVQQTPSE